MLAAAGCEPAIPNYPYAGDCEVEAGVCGVHSGGGVGAAPADGGTTGTGMGGASGASELQGSVSLITSECFTAGTTFTGAASIVVQPAAGSPITVGVGGTNPMTFDIMGVPSSSAWILVQDTSMGGAGIFSTYTYWTLPEPPGIAVPVIDSGMFTSIANGLPSLAQTGGISTQAAHVVMQITHAGAGVAGIAATGGFGAATVVYDTGGCAYDDQATKTGAGGTIILFNAGLSGATNITLTNTATSQAFSVPVFAGAGIVSLVAVAL
jgi:hypothetical protein